MMLEKRWTPQLQRSCADDTSLIYLDLGNGKNRMAGSALAQVYNGVGNDTPDVDNISQLKLFFDTMQRLNKDDDCDGKSAVNHKIMAYHDRSDGGLFATLAEMAFAGRMGVDVDLSSLHGHVNEILFTEELGGVIQVHNQYVDDVLRTFKTSDVPAYIIGKPTLEQKIVIRKDGEIIINRTRSDLQTIWSETSYQIQRLRDNPECANEEKQNINNDDDLGLHSYTTFNQTNIIVKKAPKIAILREQGVNGQVEMAGAFYGAGFETYDVHMSDLIAGDTNLSEFNALVACGGFSYGDVLGAGGGWAKSILFNEQLKEQFQEFFVRPDTFTLGVCNGCQMLSQLSSIIGNGDTLPKFVKNTSNQFEARTVMVTIPETKSILLNGMAGSRMPIHVAHGEGHVRI